MRLNDSTTLFKGQHLTLSEQIEIQTLKCQMKSNRFVVKAMNEIIRSLSQGNPKFVKLFKSITSDNGFKELNYPKRF